jgi:CheY-like chemotaxis protein
LLVDDNADLARSMAELLEHFGHQVQIAHDGEQALTKAVAFAPDVVFLDIGMPGMSGYEVAKRLRQEPGFANTLLVAVTGFGMDGEEEQARRSGFDRQLVKPVRSVDLQEVLAEESTRTH